MSVKGKKKFILLGIIIFTIPILYGVYNFIKIQLVPVTDFSFKQEKSQQEDFVKSTIIFKNQLYISDYDEFCLEPLNNIRDEVIGRDKNDNKVYSITGQDEYNYIMFLDYGEMQIPTIFRKASIPSINFSNMKFNKIRIFNRELTITNELNEDIIKSLKQVKDSRISLKPQDVYGIDLISPNLKGIGYSINVYVYNNEFYFASRGYDKCVKTSHNFSLWLKSILASSKG
ncbi:MAG: hypothetical protein N3B21_00375 [Clostridia bacterium]|nr:hypothetical protein [Clostridia bacterium]